MTYRAAIVREGEAYKNELLIFMKVGDNVKITYLPTNSIIKQVVDIRIAD